MPDPNMDPREIAQFMVDTGVQFISATPSYWRRLLMFADGDVLRRVPLTQITVGGEVVDQQVLDKLRQCFPGVRLVHIYATTEMGRCFSVSDGMAGFPVSYLHTKLRDGAELKSQNGELFVRSPNSMCMYDPLSSHGLPSTEWFATGDLVELRDDRVYFIGRKSDMINVAGAKVYPVEVERIIRSIPGVFDVRVFGKSSSIAGELVVCEVVAAMDQDPEMLREAIMKACHSKLSSHQRPRLIKVVDRLELSAAAKTLRTRIA